MSFVMIKSLVFSPYIEHKAMKRIFDFTMSLFLILLLLFPFVILLVFIFFFNDVNGLFFQKRIGLNGVPFLIYKIRTFNSDNKVSNLSKFLRKYKIDELPQLVNVLKGEMSFVGPRPEVLKYLGDFSGKYAVVLLLKPGLTSLATIKYFNEEDMLRSKDDPEEYNDTVIFPDKLNLNLKYYEEHSLYVDIRIIIKTMLKLIR